jgi:methionyl-tRNA formyltransferase
VISKAGKRIGVVGCKHTTKDLILGLDRCGIQIDHCLTLSPEKGDSQQVAGYFDLRPFLDQKGIPWTHASHYNLKSEEDKDALLPLRLDVLLVMGWQRLIPDWFLQSLSIGAFGMHGSSKPLPHGRGRSPMNWSLIQDKKLFYTHLFQYKPGVDDGPVAGVQTFDITAWDDCHTLHLKNTVAMIKLCAEHLPLLLKGIGKLQPQTSEGASYYPKREAADGMIYWEDDTKQIFNLTRAVTKPFPGAFSYLDNDPLKKVIIWKAIPFDTQLVWKEASTGEIVQVFYDGTFVVKTSDSTLFVQDCEGYSFTSDDVGRRFGSLGAPRKKWENLPD